MTRCDLCKSLSVELLNNNEVAFHDDLPSLKRSAQSGCDFCNLCWGQIESDWPRARVDACLQGRSPSDHPAEQHWVPQMWLRGEFYDKRPQVRLGHHLRSTVWLSCGKLDEENLTLGASTRLSLFAAPGTPAASRFVDRMSTRDLYPELAAQMAKEWLHSCINGAGPSGHRNCNANMQDVMPTRVIDVGSTSHDSARLVITDGLREPYGALSYCWGPSARKSLKLTRENLTSLTHSLPVDELSAAHKDMFRLARELGIRYVWIDALCIIQGDPEDWEYESPRMGRVYGNALVTIIAARSGDSGQGFIENSLDQKPPPCPLPLAKPEDGVVDASGLFACLPRSVGYGPVTDRAWCFQEMHLSRRSLVYAKEQVLFRCRERVVFEDGESREEQLAGVAITAGPLASLRQAFNPFGPRTSPVPLGRRERVLKTWYNMVVDYTTRELSNPYDIFAGISSIAQLAEDSLESRYLAGIWEGDMVRGLLWKSRHQAQGGRSEGHSSWEPVRRPEPTFLAPGPIRRAPSWSWAAVQGPTMHIWSLGGSRYKADKVVVRPKRSDPDRWTTRQDCGARVLYMPSCELQVIGRLKALQVMKSKEVSDCTPWDLRHPAHPYIWAKMCRNGVLLEPLETSTQVGVGQAGSLSNVKAIGVFDIAHEAVSHVWCLRLVEAEGLMLVEAGDGKYARAGWFTVENREWFEQGDEVEVVLV